MSNWDHSVRINHILRFSADEIVSRWERGRFKVGETISIRKKGRRLYVDGPILLCDEQWRMLGYIQIETQTLTRGAGETWKTEVFFKVLTVFSVATSNILSRENAAAQRAAGNQAATWPPPNDPMITIRR